MDSPDGSYQPTLSLSGAKWQLDGRQAAAMTGAKPHRRSNWHDCCLPASERSGLVIATNVGMRTAFPIGLGKHLVGIILCSVAAFFFLLFVTYVGWDVGDARSGDVVRPESSFSLFERVCFGISHGMTSPLRLFGFSEYTTSEIIGFCVLSLTWGVIAYVSAAAFIRILRRHYSRIHHEVS